MTDKLRERLMHEAATLLPAFSEPLHERVMVAVSGTVREPVPVRRQAYSMPRLAVAGVVAACCAVAVFSLLRSAPQPPPLRHAVPEITLRIVLPEIPDVRREAGRTVRRAKAAVERLLEEGPISIVSHEPSRK